MIRVRYYLILLVYGSCSFLPAEVISVKLIAFWEEFYFKHLIYKNFCL